MQEVIYSNSDIELLRSMKVREYLHIYYDGCCQFVFDFPNRHILGCATDFAAATQNRYDEAITLCFESKPGQYQPPTPKHLLLANSLIERIWIARTVLYFTDCRPLKSEEEKVRGISDSTPTGKILRDYFLEAPSISGYAEIVSHPSVARQGRYFSDRYSNLVDTGILLQIEDFFLSCFSRQNNLIIPAVIQSKEELENDPELKNFQLIEI